ncbi:YadA-like family protein [Thiopseudomonas alkaliphila]|nr:YadA-like family protein [Thiopseudomonas alkaliphila]
MTSYASATNIGDTGAVGEGSIAVGPIKGDCSSKTTARGKHSVSIGCETGAFADGNNQTNLGYQAGISAEGNYNTAIGSNSGEGVTGNTNTALGYNSGQNITGSDNSFIGNGAGSSTKGDANVALGLNAGTNVKGNNNIALGRDAGKAIEGTDNAAFGSNAGEGVAGNYNTAFGRSAGKGIKGDSNTSLGNGAGMSQQGKGNLSAGLTAGQGVHGDFNVMLGNDANVDGSSKSNPVSRTVVIGSEAKAWHDDTVALGSNTKAAHKNSVALGHASETKTAVQVVKGEITDEQGIKHTYSDFAGVSDSGVVSVGKAGAERQLVHVAPGAISKSSTDAINGSQLFSVGEGINNQINNLGDSVATSLGGNSKYTGGKVNAELNVGGKTYTNVQDALNNISTEGGWVLGSMDSQGADQSLKVSAGGKVNLAAGKNMDVVSSKDPTSGEVTTTFSTKSIVDFEKVTAGNAVMNTDGFSIQKGPSVTQEGIDVADKKITRLQAGSALTDGVNVSQLKGLGDVIGDITINDKGQITGPTFTVSNKNYTTIADAITQLDKGWTLTAGNQTAQIQSGNKVGLTAGKNMKITSEKDADGNITSTFATEDDVAFTKVTTGNSTLSNQGLTVGSSVFINDQGLSFSNSKVSVGSEGINAGGKRITDVAVGTADTDAVNVSQLKEVKEVANSGWNLSVNGGNAEKVAPKDTVNFTEGDNIKISQNGKDITISSTPDVTHNSVTTGNSKLSDQGLTVGKNVAVTDKGFKAGDTLVSDQGLTFEGSDVSVSKDGINAGDKKVLGVADGIIAAGSKDAVNGGQLHELQVEVNKQAGGWTLSDGSTDQQVKAGDKVTIKGEGNINVLLDNATGQMTVQTNPNVEHESVTTGDTVINNSGLMIKEGPSVTKNGIDAGDKKVLNVAQGEISSTSKDAINGSQLNDTNNRVTINEGDIKNIQQGQDGMFQVSNDYNTPKPKPVGEKSVAGGAGAIAKGNNSAAIGNNAQANANNSVALGNGSVADRENSVSVGNIGDERQITNVAAGVLPTDAVNVGQLEALGGRVNQYFNSVNKRIDKVDNNARAGIAAAMAAGTLPQSSLPGKSMVTLGASTYRGESALAIGVSRLSDNARTVIKVNASADSRGNAGAAVGAGWHW